MAYKAELKVDGYNRKDEDPNNVRKCNYRLSRLTSYNEPTSDLRGGEIHLEINSSEKDNFFVDWMNTYDKGKKGSVLFKSAEEETVRTLEFSDAHLSNYMEAFTADGENIESFTIVTQDLKINGTEIEVNKG
ncbi:type VI secretion system tube protein TssD [Xanthovirga aplysinae]|uniref:type VI secretion system tube protein TssD n=1 Tax=Xanthovirga aplysinae TaxID=2529853 RepID=UPI0012BC8374|nr:type VI secretion system tube protein TssD [Xanthovirga aplysinae]MTI29760.1 hypothetical protein [Xanthovirga aplysinae]